MMAVAEMNHPVRHDPARTGEVVHEDHHEHNKPAQCVDRGDASGAEHSSTTLHAPLIFGHQQLVSRHRVGSNPTLSHRSHEIRSITGQHMASPGEAQGNRSTAM